MKFFKKLLEIFKKTKSTVATVELKVQTFIKKHKKQIKILMNILDVIYPAKTGIKKMSNVVVTVCCALGLNEYSEDIKKYVETECQKVFDELRK